MLSRRVEQLLKETKFNNCLYVGGRKAVRLTPQWHGKFSR